MERQIFAGVSQIPSPKIVHIAGTIVQDVYFSPKKSYKMSHRNCGRNQKGRKRGKSIKKCLTKGLSRSIIYKLTPRRGGRNRKRENGRALKKLFKKV